MAAEMYKETAGSEFPGDMTPLYARKKQTTMTKLLPYDGIKPYTQVTNSARILHYH